MSIGNIARRVLGMPTLAYSERNQLVAPSEGLVAVYGPKTTELLIARNKTDLSDITNRLGGSGGTVRNAKGSDWRIDPDSPFKGALYAPSYSASLHDFGLTMDDLRKNKFPNVAGMSEAANKALIAPPIRPSEQISLIIQQQFGNTGTPLPLEQVQVRFAAINLANKYFLNDSVAGPSIRSLYEFVIGPGFTVDVEYTFLETPGWFNPGNPEVADVKRNYAGKASKDKNLTIFIDYLTKRAQHLKEDLDLDSLAVDMARDALVAGDAFCYRIDSIIDDTYVDNLQPKAEFLFNDVIDVQAINPLAVILMVDEFNQLLSATVRAAGPSSGAGVPVPDLTKFIHLKWQGSRYSIYGTSHMSNAINELILKEALMAAARASAQRYAVPIRLAQYGVMAPGSDGGPIALPIWKDDLVNALTTFNAETDTLVGPFHWDIKLIGAEGKILDIAEQIEATDRRVMMAMGIPPNFLDSNYTSYSTAKIQMQNMLLKLRQLQIQVGRAIERGIIGPWAEMRGYRDPNGNLIKFKIRWHRAELESDPEMLTLIASLAKIPGQRYLSRTTIRETIGVDSEIEDRNIAAEKDLDIQQGFLDQSGQPLGQSPKQKPGDPTTPTGTPAEVNKNAPNHPKEKAQPAGASLDEEIQEVLGQLVLDQHELRRRTDESYAEIQKISRRQKKIEKEENDE